jgi:hypothetical protein
MNAQGASQNGVDLKIIEDIRVNQPRYDFEADQCRRGQEEEDTVNPPVKPIPATRQCRERKEEKDGNGQYRSFQDENDVVPAQHSPLPFAQYTSSRWAA